MLRADKEVRLNASTLSSTSSLIVSLRSDSVPNIPITALVDSSSTHCFIESVFIHKHKIPTRQIPLIPLRLFDGSVNATISKSVELLVRFPSHDTFSVDFYVTLLDSSCSVVLGHNWLTRYNPLIDWVLGSITFRTPIPDSLANPPLVNSRAASAPDPIPPEPRSTLKLEAPRIALINAAAFMRVCKLEGYITFRLDLASLELSRRAASVPETYDPLDLLDIPEDYHNFADVFSKAKADTPAPHRPYDLKITLEDSKEPPQPLIYPLSTSELKTLQEFLDEHLNIGFI